MPAKDRYHDKVKRALIKDGWTIRKEQARLSIGGRRMWADLHTAKTALNAIILVEVKTLGDSASIIEELANAVGKYVFYQLALESMDDPTPLYLAVPSSAYDGILSEELGQRLIERIGLLLIVFDPEQEEIKRWMPPL